MVVGVRFSEDRFSEDKFSEVGTDVEGGRKDRKEREMMYWRRGTGLLIGGSGNWQIERW